MRGNIRPCWRILTQKEAFQRVKPPAWRCYTWRVISVYLITLPFLYFLYWVSPIKRQIIGLCHVCFFRLTFKKFEWAKKCSKEKALNFLFYWRKTTTTTKPPSYTLRRFHIFGLTFSGPKEVCWFCPSETRSERWTPPALPPIPLRKRGRPAWGNRLGYYRAFMLPSCVVWPKQRPRVKASCKIYVHAAVSVGGKINIAGLMHGDDWVLSDWQ